MSPPRERVWRPRSGRTARAASSSRFGGSWGYARPDCLKVSRSDMAGLAQSLRAAWGVDLTTPGRDNIEDVIAAIDEHAATAALEVAAGVVRELLSRRSS